MDCLNIKLFSLGFFTKNKKDDKHAIKLIKKNLLHLKSRLACRHFLSAWFRWIPLLGVRVLMASGSAMIHRNWCEKWVNKYNRSRRRLTQFFLNQYRHLLVLWQWSNHFCLSVIPQLCVNYHWHLQGGGRGVALFNVFCR